MKKPLLHKPPLNEPPEHLSAAARDWFLSLQAEYGIFDTAGVSLLTCAAESWDRCTSAREAIASDGGPVVRDRFDQTKTHPAAAIERDSRAQFMAALKALNLDLEPLRPGPGRPTNPVGWKGEN